MFLGKVGALLEWADELLSKMLEWIVSIGYPLNCYDYLSTCGNKNSSNLILDYSFDPRVQDESTLGLTNQRENYFQKSTCHHALVQ